MIYKRELYSWFNGTRFRYSIPLALNMADLSIIVDWLDSWGTTISGFGSLLLSGVLAWLYYKQHGVLKKQLDVDTDPDLIVEEIDVSRKNPNAGSAYDYQFSYLLSNIGRGRASNLEMKIVADIINKDVELEPVKEPLSRTQEEVDGDKTLSIRGGGNYLESGEGKVKFTVPAHTAGFHVNSKNVSKGGHFLLSTLPEPIAELEIGSSISVREFPDCEAEKVTSYSLSLEEDDNVAVVLDYEPNADGFPVEIEKRTRKRLTEDEVQKITNNAVGTLFVRIKHILEYYDSDGEKHSEQVMDRVFPSRFGVSNDVLYSSGLKYERFNLKGDKKSMIERRMYSSMFEDNRGN